MKLAIFDLDNTLINGDSDYLWGRFLCAHGYVDCAAYQSRHDYYYQQYKAGTLDIFAFLAFQLECLAAHDLVTLQAWRRAYMQEMIRPVILPAARSLVEMHRRHGHELLIITATNRFLTEPIAREFNIADLIASDPEMRDGRYTGRVVGTPSYAAGKVSRLTEWLKARHALPEERWFYSDSHNDLPLLQAVDHPVAVDPDDVLADKAKQVGWEIISLR